MADFRTIKYWLALQLAFGVGSGKLGGVLELTDSAIDFYRGGERLWSRIENLRTAELERLRRPDQARIENILTDCEKLGCHIVTPEDREYPDRLRSIYGPPAVLFVLGDLTFLSSAPAVIAMVGTRRCSSAGMSTAWRLGHDLAASGAAVISGMAVGIDASSHLGALAAKGKTVALMPLGLETVTPPENEFLWHRIIAGGGAVVSEWPPYSRVDWKASFHTRNRLISGMAQGVVLVESRERSGANITFRHGLEQGRDIFVVPWDASSEAGRWAVELLRQGAVPVCSAKQILEDYETPKMTFPDRKAGRRRAVIAAVREETGADRREEEPSEETVPEEREELKKVLEFPKTPKEELGELERRLLPWLTEDGQYPEQLADNSGLEIGELMQALTELEVAGWAQAMPGGRYAGNGEETAGDPAKVQDEAAQGEDEGLKE